MTEEKLTMEELNNYAERLRDKANQLLEDNLNFQMELEFYKTRYLKLLDKLREMVAFSDVELNKIFQL